MHALPPLPSSSPVLPQPPLRRRGTVLGEFVLLPCEEYLPLMHATSNQWHCKVGRQHADRLCPKVGKMCVCDTFPSSSSLFSYPRNTVFLFLLLSRNKESAILSHPSWPARGTNFQSSNPQPNRVSQQMFELSVRTRGPTPPQALPSTFRQFHTTRATPTQLSYRQACCGRTLFANDLLCKDILN
jgi:hypothetical protein